MGLDNGGDAEQESTDFELEPGDENTVDFKFEIPYDARSGNYIVDMRVQGEDANRTSSVAEETVRFAVIKRSHDLKIKSITLNPAIVGCSRKSKISASFANIGANSEEQFAFEFMSSRLNLNSIDGDISLNAAEENSIGSSIYEKSMNVNVPASYGAGVYPIFVNVYWKNNILFDHQEADLIVKACNADKQKQNIYGNKTAISTQEPITPEYYQPQESSSAIISSPVLLLLTSGTLIVLAIIFILIFISLRRNGKL